MIPAGGALNAPYHGVPVQLLRWRPSNGVLSLYISIDPGDRSEGWRTVARIGLSEAIDSASQDGHKLRSALKATAERLRRSLDEDWRAEHRGLIGFVEVATTHGEERWYTTQIGPSRTEVRLGPRPQVHRLLELLDDGAPLGVAAVSSERVRLLDWRLGDIEQLHDWELEYFAGDWKERKAQRPRDPARGEAVSSSGRDQYDQRLEATRERFAAQTGRLARAESRARHWHRAMVVGDQRYAAKFSEGLRAATKVTHIDADLVAEPTGLLQRRVEEILPSLNRARERGLIDRIKDAAYTDGRSSLGVQETLQALGEGRVRHLVYDAGRDYAADAAVPAVAPALNRLPVIERLVGLALSTGAEITPVEAESARELAEQGGVAALLRY